MKKLSIDQNRLAETFKSLVRIDSVSREEGEISQEIQGHLKNLGAEITVDDAGLHLDGQTGNIIARLSFGRNDEPMLLAAHMDTVEPGRGVQPLYRDGVFSSSGDTILGADDKSAIAIILEVLLCIREQNLPCVPLEIVFTICEEIGLLGVKHLKYEELRSKKGFVLDTRNPGTLITRAPAANRLAFRIHGKAAHAGSSPEKGINAIAVASKAIAEMKLGRIDQETTCNIGRIQGGLATNIVPELVIVHGEARSHDIGKLNAVTTAILSAFEQSAGSCRADNGSDRPRIESEVAFDFDRLSIAEDHPTIRLALRAAENLGRPIELAASGGGSDANIFAAHGIVTPVLGTGMQDVHTVEETIRLKDMVCAAQLVLEILSLQAAA